MSENLLKCISCGNYIERGKAFTCSRCKKSPLCLSHKDPEYSVCAGCASEIRIKLLKEMRGRQKHMADFMKLMEFLFVLCAIMFAALRLIPDFVPDFVRDNVLTKNLYAWGGISLAGSAALFIVVRMEGGKIKEVEERIHRPVERRAAI